MQVSNHFLETHHATIADQMNAQLAGFKGIEIVKKFSYSSEKKTLTGLLKVAGETKRVDYNKDDGSSEESLRDAINLDLAVLFYKCLPKEKKQTNLEIIFGNCSMETIEFTVSNEDFCFSTLEANPKDKDLSKRIYDFATGILNIGLMEWMFDDSQREDRCEGSFDIPGAGPCPLPASAAIPTPSRPENLMQMPFVNLRIKV